MDNFDLKKYLGNNPLTKESLNEGITWENRKSGERLPTMEDYKEAYNKKQVKEGPVEDFEDEEFEAHSASLVSSDDFFQPIRTDILATIDELNQYLNGNVTKDSLVETLNGLLLTITNSREA